MKQKHKILAVLLILVYAFILVNGIASTVTNNKLLILISDISYVLFVIIGGLSILVIIMVLFNWDEIKKEEENGTKEKI